MMNQLDFLDEFFEDSEQTAAEINSLKEKYDHLRKGICRRLSEQQKRLDEMQTALDYLYSHRPFVK